MARNWNIFINTLFFVLGFSFVFSLVGVLLQTVLSSVSYTAQTWFSRIGGTIIILFGLFMLGVFKPFFLLKEHKFKIKRVFSTKVNSFLFGASFAVGWTPCVSAALGAILTLATIHPSSSFLLLMAYTLGIGVPFLLVGFFADKATTIILRNAKYLQYIQYFFGVVLVILGILVFSSQLNRVVNFEIFVDVYSSLGIQTSIGEDINSLTLFSFVIAFIAGLVSFLSPCVLPLLPAFLSYISTTEKNHE